ncbi:MAG: DUF1993 domain-containing protein [Pseudomonadota bacterium]
MSLDIHADVVPALIRALQQLQHILRKSRAHAEAQGWDPAVLLGMRLAPDMFPLIRQVQIAVDIAKNGVGRLGDGQAPVFEDSETDFEGLEARVQRAIDYIAGVPAAAFGGAESRPLVVPSRAYGELKFVGRGYLTGFVLPNVYFHITTAYALLRHAGVPLGKADYLGPAGRGE